MNAHLSNPRPLVSSRLVILSLLVCTLASTNARAQLCGGPLDNNNFHRPVDFRDRAREGENINIVERYHFTQNVEALISGETTPLPGDISYVLRHIPNHYRALAAMARWDLMHPRMPDASYLTVDCYFERAFAFHPEDPNPYFMYAVYLHRKKDYDRALSNYQQAQSLGLDTAELYYNMGLLYLDMNDLKLARTYADKAYGMGYPLPGLRKRLDHRGAQ
jgi:tetratricopeptide (TPR) repeat protein